jgi:cell shape-determining protein MreC
LGNIFSGTVGTILAARQYFENSSATLPTYVRDRSELLSEIQDLRETIGAQSGSAATIERLTEENEEFRALLGDDTEERIAAGVIARPPFSPYDSFVLDRGTEDGITEGAIVYHTSDYAIGYVRHAYSKSSVVALFSSPGIESTVYVYGPDIYATAYGEGGGIIRISVPQGVSLTEGNVVVLPTLDTGILGTIGTVTSVPTQPEQHAYLSFPVSMQSIRIVGVERNPIAEVSFKDAALNVDAFRTKFLLDVPPELRLSVGTSTASTTLKTLAPSSTPNP